MTEQGLNAAIVIIAIGIAAWVAMVWSVVTGLERRAADLAVLNAALAEAVRRLEALEGRLCMVRPVAAEAARPRREPPAQAFADSKVIDRVQQAKERERNAQKAEAEILDRFDFIVAADRAVIHQTGE